MRQICSKNLNEHVYLRHGLFNHVPMSGIHGVITLIANSALIKLCIGDLNYAKLSNLTK